MPHEALKALRPYLDDKGRKSIDDFLKLGSKFEIWGIGGRAIDPGDLSVDSSRKVFTALDTDLDLSTILARRAAAYLCVGDESGTNLIFVNIPPQDDNDEFEDQA